MKDKFQQPINEGEAKQDCKQRARLSRRGLANIYTMLAKVLVEKTESWSHLYHVFCSAARAFIRRELRQATNISHGVSPLFIFKMDNLQELIFIVTQKQSSNQSRALS